MPAKTQHKTLITRRRLLQASLVGGALAVGGGSAYLAWAPTEPVAESYQWLRSSEVQLLSYIVPVVLAGNRPQNAEQLQDYLTALDYKLLHLSWDKAEQLRQLFTLLSQRWSRWPLTGIWQDWSEASTEQIQAFLQRWQHSSLSVLVMGQAALTQLLLLTRYSQLDSWAHCGYPGPPDILG